MRACAKRIAVFVSTSGHSGVDRAMKHLIPELVLRGYEVDLLKVRGHGPEIPFEHPRFRKVDLGTGHTYGAAFAVARYLRRERPVVMLSDKDRVNRTALLARALARVPTRLVFSSGTTISVDLAHRGRFERWLQRTSMGGLYRYADKVIVTCKAVADDMAAYTGLDRRLIHDVESPVVPDALLQHTFPPPAHPWFQAGEPPVILGTGALVARKGFETLIRAFALVRRERPSRLVILGEGKRKEALRRLARDLGVGADIDLPGFVETPYPYMAHARLFAFTSQWEGLGFVLIEALAVGTPVVSTDCPSGPAEILAGGRYGRLVPVGDAERLAEAITATLASPLPADTLREAARPYTVSAATDAYLAAMGLPPEAGASGEGTKGTTGVDIRDVRHRRPLPG